MKLMKKERCQDDINGVSLTNYKVMRFVEKKLKGVYDSVHTLGGGTGYEVQTEDDTAMSLIQAHPSVTDRSRTLERLGPAVQAAASGRDAGQTQSQRFFLGKFKRLEKSQLLRPPPRLTAAARGVR